MAKNFLCNLCNIVPLYSPLAHHDLAILAFFLLLKPTKFVLSLEFYALSCLLLEISTPPDHSRLALSSGHNVTSSKRWSQKRCHITLFIFFPQQLS